MVNRRLRDRDTRTLIGQLVQHGGTVYRTPLAISTLGLESDPLPPNASLPIGSCLSQWAANLYLDGLDQHVKRMLGVRAYLRYMDDMAFFADDRGWLVEVRAAVLEWLRDERGLELNRKRWHVVPAAQPSTYLGYRVSRAGMAPSRKLGRRVRVRAREAAARGPDALRATLESYRALVCAD